MSAVTKGARHGNVVYWTGSNGMPMSGRVMKFLSDHMYVLSSRRIWDKEQNRHRWIGHIMWAVPYADIRVVAAEEDSPISHDPKLTHYPHHAGRAA